MILLAYLGYPGTGKNCPGLSDAEGLYFVVGERSWLMLASRRRDGVNTVIPYICKYMPLMLSAMFPQKMNMQDR